ncbi:MAG: GNAT family N-acetyltransferase [Oscillospiraceae bacterium]|nr:GNAT family N-acetyltransferase [Oscillospiraceae bacterium]
MEYNIYIKYSLEDIMFITKRIGAKSKDLKKIEKLYIEAFPENERFSFSKMIKNESGSYETFGFYKDENFCGFAILLNSKDISHILYIATLPELRGSGLGTKALAALRRIKKDMRIIVDIERELLDCEENELRRRRKNFYLRNGYEETDIRYRWQEESYEILSSGGIVTKEDFGNFWKNLGINKNAKDE